MLAPEGNGLAAVLSQDPGGRWKSTARVNKTTKAARKIPFAGNAKGPMVAAKS
jgi:hypothetical protein